MSRVSPRTFLCGMRPLRAAALPVSAAHIINIRSYQPAPQYGKWYRMHISATPERAIFGPLQLYDFQRSRKAKTTFETFSTTSNVVFLRSYVSNTACGTVFGLCGNAFFDKRKKCAIFECRRYISEAGVRGLIKEDLLPKTRPENCHKRHFSGRMVLLFLSAYSLFIIRYSPRPPSRGGREESASVIS